MNIWTKQNMFDPATVQKSVTTSRLERIKLLFKPVQYSYDHSEQDGVVIVKYKKMNGITYVLNVEHYEPEEIKQ